jgi:hypothetical protein
MVASLITNKPVSFEKKTAIIMMMDTEHKPEATMTSVAVIDPTPSLGSRTIGIGTPLEFILSTNSFHLSTKLIKFS